jgi:hypothetical protein
MDFTAFGRNQTLDWVTGKIVSPPTQMWVQLHIGDPGINGSDNVAAETTRKLASWGDADVDGKAYNNAALEWILVVGTEVLTHISVWSQAVAGIAWYQGQLTSPVPVTVGADFTIAAGDAVIQHQ